MATKTPTAPKKTKTAAPALRITTAADKSGAAVHSLLTESLTASQLKEALRARKLPIPKDKATMAARLRIYLRDRKAKVTVDIDG